jgi:YaiO family outer membrane protein
VRLPIRHAFVLLAVVTAPAPAAADEPVVTEPAVQQPLRPEPGPQQPLGPEANAEPRAEDLPVPELRPGPEATPQAGSAPHPPVAPAATVGFVEAGGGYDRLTAGEPSWNDEYVRGHVRVTPSDAFDLETSRQSHFGDHGTHFGLGYTRILSDRWYASAHAGVSDGGFFLPRARFDAFVHRKWLSGRNLVTAIGVAYSRARDVHSDRILSFDALYYFDAPWIVEAGARLNDSDPGSVVSARGHVAATYGRDKHHYLTLRYERGRESYLLIAEDQAVSDFASDELSLVWRQWLTGRVGFNARAVRYANPTYRRLGVAVGLFWEF